MKNKLHCGTFCVVQKDNAMRIYWLQYEIKYKNTIKGAQARTRWRKIEYNNGL